MPGLETQPAKWIQGMRSNTLVAFIFFITSAAFFATGNTSLGAVFVAVGAVFIALEADDEKKPK